MGKGRQPNLELITTSRAGETPALRPLTTIMTTSAHTVIKSIYEAINRRDVPAAMQFVDDECIYQDLNFPQPFQGKQAVEQLFTESCHNVPDDLQFVIDEITTGDRLTVGR